MAIFACLLSKKTITRRAAFALSTTCHCPSSEANNHS